MNVTAPAPASRPTSSLTLAFNPKGFLPGKGPRELNVSLTHGADGQVDVRSAVLGESFQLPRPVPTHRWRDGDRTTPRLQGAIDALEGALQKLLPALERTPSDENDVDNGYGWARGNSFALRTGPAATVGTEYYYGTFGREQRPAVAEAVTLLRDLAEALRKDA